MHRRHVLSLLSAAPLIAVTGTAAATGGFVFESIDGGQYDLNSWRGQPILVVNTASLCGFTHQYDALQALHETYGPRGLVVLAVPSDDFAQELGSDSEVAEFCEMHFGLTLPMTTITSVRGRNAHPFYRWLRQTAGFQPRWNFNKVLLDGDGQVVDTFGSQDAPMGPQILSRVVPLLPA